MNCCTLSKKYIFKSSIKVYGKIVFNDECASEEDYEEYVRYSLDEGYAMVVDYSLYDPIYENVFYCPFCGEKLE